MTTAPTSRPAATSGPVPTKAASPPERGERLPPQDLDAEMALLGAMMMSREAIGEVVPIIGREESGWFYLPAHQKLFEVLLDLYDDPSKAIDLVVVSDELRRRDLLEAIGGQEYMIQLAESFADWANAAYYARIVRDKGMLRDLIRCAGEIAESAYAEVEEAREILDLAEQRIFAVTERRVGGSAVAVREVVHRLAKQLEVGERSVCTGMPTGFTQLDELTSGLQAGDLVIVAGRPSMGKTALGLTIATYAALQERRPVGFFSMEMSVEQLAQRVLCAHTGIDAQKLRRRMLSEEEIRRLCDACAEFESAPLFIDDTPGMTIMELRSKARRLKQKHDVQAVFVDYLQLMHVPRAESRQVEIATISRGLKALGRELNIPVVALAQLNRMPEGRHDKRPLMSDLRESGAIEQDADVILLIHREEYYHPEDENVRNQAELIIAKQRNGPTGSITLHFDKKLTRFANHYVGPEPFGTPSGSDDVAPF
ncbi:MAG: replicative DNA helicase [Planctomycetota bacterium]|nr:MAG: replicative DNA helicase [Planctomycetota bacterium]